MATAAELITDSLGELLVQESEQSVESVEMQTSIRYLNRMMSEWAARGMSLGFTQIVNPVDIVTVPDGALSAIVYNLAIKLAKQYDSPMTVDLAANAKDGMRAILDLTVTVEATQMPNTMPIGSGNEGYWNGGSTNDHFYPGVDTDTLTDESNRNITLETDT
jgi:hypothetical protein